MADRTDKDRRNRRRKLNTKGRLKTGSRMKDRFSDGLWFSGRCSDGLKPRPLPRTGGGGLGWGGGCRCGNICGAAAKRFCEPPPPPPDPLPRWGAGEGKVGVGAAVSVRRVGLDPPITVSPLMQLPVIGDGGSRPTLRHLLPFVGCVACHARGLRVLGCRCRLDFPHPRACLAAHTLRLFQVFRLPQKLWG